MQAGGEQDLSRGPWLRWQCRDIPAPLSQAAAPRGPVPVAGGQEVGAQPYPQQPWCTLSPAHPLPTRRYQISLWFVLLFKGSFLFTRRNLLEVTPSSLPKQPQAPCGGRGPPRAQHPLPGWGGPRPAPAPTSSPASGGLC